MKRFLFSDRKIVNILQISSQKRPDFVILREYDLNLEQKMVYFKKISSQILSSCSKLTAKRTNILISQNLYIARKLKAKGIHVSDRNHRKSLFFKPNLPKNLLISSSCHNMASFTKINRNKKINFVFISPIFKEKQQNRPKNIYFLRKINQKSRKDLQICALGGVNEGNLRILKKSKINGFGAISYFKN